MRREDYPDLFQSADKASVTAQNKFVRMFSADLACIIGASVLAVCRAIVPSGLANIFGIAVPFLLGVSLIVKLTMRARRFDSVWFDCRAVAESVKTTVWRFLMAIHPYDQSTPDDVAETRFLLELDTIRRARPAVSGELASFPVATGRITPIMKETRRLNLVERKAFYLAHRLSDQRTWYRSNAKANADAAETIFRVTLVIQALAIIVLLFQMEAPQGPNTVAVFTTAIAVVTAWSEMRKYRDLTNSYAVAADELVSAEAKWTHVDREELFQEQVLQIEEAISREHTMWCAKRT